MDLLGWILFATAAAAVVWLLVERGRVLWHLAKSEEQRDAAVTEVRTALENASRLQRQVEDLLAQRTGLQLRVKELEGQLQAAEEVHAERTASLERREQDLRRSLEEIGERYRSVFQELAADALGSASEQFLKLAREHQLASVAEMDKRREGVDQLLAPIRESLRQTQDRVAALDGASRELREETQRLVRALSRPEVRGRYGEIQLRRVVELAGMKDYCDFSEQASTRDDDGRVRRPDLTVRLPNDRRILVDAKMNTSAYLEAVHATTEEQREACLARFTEHVASQIEALAQKDYGGGDAGAYDFVVMFIPADQFLDAALSRRPDLLERAVEKNVVLTTPSTLIALLRAVAVGWREKRLEEQARELFDLGRQLHERAATALEHVASLGQALEQASRRYNQMVGSIESRLLPGLRRFAEADLRGGKELPTLPQVSTPVRRSDNEGM